MADLPKSLALVLKLISFLTRTKLATKMCGCSDCLLLWELQKSWKITEKQRQARRHWNIIVEVEPPGKGKQTLTVRFPSMESGLLKESITQLLVQIIKEYRGSKTDVASTKLG